jgi:hypothetical protein
MSHKRSLEAKQKRRNARRDRDMANSIVLDWSWHDQVNVRGEIVFIKPNVKVCQQKIVEKVGYVPESVLNREFGEVLNYQEVVSEVK